MKEFCKSFQEFNGDRIKTMGENGTFAMEKGGRCSAHMTIKARFVW